MAKIISASLLRRPFEVILEEKGLLDKATIEIYSRRAMKEQVTLEEILVKDGKVTSDQVYMAIADSYGLAFTDLKDYRKLETLGNQAAEI